MTTNELPPLKRGFPAVVLISESTGKVACYACAKCGTVHTIANVQLAELCCYPKVCGSEGCDEYPPKHRIYCRDCSAKLDAEKEAKSFEAATKIPYAEWKGGHLYSERLDKYFPGWGEYLEEIENDEEFGDPEPYLWDCTRMGMSIDSESVIECALSDHHEDAYDYVSDEEGLQKLLDEWCAKQTDVVTFYPTSNRAVIAPVENEQ